ncbi:MBL fold metallo-hydrolase [uncultured Candidatus Pelagibacter sp.]|jgi:L-ascorbate metabolism protein UlaG (beta-lactamase superfamily)|uniref:MBL fold metallo-hydrolase n=1 Tax=uncultured Candidatus Pelagibacter sp. TaxID=372654 RepID=UPI00262838DA|nr:MBL fold metallo-hydrolase [uncultured Candidatus Pelagibacter sp.]
MKKLISFLFIILFFNIELIAMEKLPYHHLPDGTFRNPEGSPVRTNDVKFSYRTFIKEKKKIDITVPKDHVIDKKIVKENLEKFKDDDYIAWIGHATFLIKLGETTIITDPVFSKNAGPLIFGPKRYVEPAIQLKDIPKTDVFLLTHNHYDHQDMSTIRRFPYKDAKVLLPLKLGKYFKKYKDVNEMDWYEEIKINDHLKITFLPAVHWSKRSLTDTNKTLWGNFLIQYKNIKILFACDTGYGNIYKEIGEKYGPIDITMINIGAYDFRPMFDKSIYHTTPEEALNVAQDLKSKKVLGMHWGTFVLSLEPVMEPLIRFKENAQKFGFKKEDAITFKIGEINSIKKILD